MARAWAYLADNTSMVGAAPKNRNAIDHYPWGREALRFCGMQTDEFEQLADKLGLGAAGEVLLLAVARKCGVNGRSGQRHAHWVSRGNRNAGHD